MCKWLLFIYLCVTFLKPRAKRTILKRHGNHWSTNIIVGMKTLQALRWFFSLWRDYRWSWLTFCFKFQITLNFVFMYSKPWNWLVQRFSIPVSWSVQSWFDDSFSWWWLEQFMPLTELPLRVACSVFHCVFNALPYQHFFLGEFEIHYELTTK